MFNYSRSTHKLARMPSDIFYCANELIYDTTAACESFIVTSFRLTVINVYACSMIKQKILLF